MRLYGGGLLSLNDPLFLEPVPRRGWPVRILDKWKSEAGLGARTQLETDAASPSEEGGWGALIRGLRGGIATDRKNGGLEDL